MKAMQFLLRYACLFWSYSICPMVLVNAWIINVPTNYVAKTWTQQRKWQEKQGSGAGTVLRSTPFEAGYYDFDDDGDDDGLESGNPYENELPSSSSSSSLRVPPDTKLVIGLNKYSHDTSICAADAASGKVLFGLSKERISRKKHDSGNVATLVESCLEALDLNLDAISRVVMNNHHHRILPLEENLKHLEWESGLQVNGGAESGYDDDENLLPHLQPGPEKLELSHHLAHAYSVAIQCPFESGMVVVMDGMGETYRTMHHAHKNKDPSYISDFSLAQNDNNNDNDNDDDDDNDNSHHKWEFQCIPSNIHQLATSTYFDWREAESVYTFQKNTADNSIHLQPIFKRFTQEHSPPTLYNHGFENMDSLGALYSRASSHIFGDWNACGKVMGLAPWIVHSWKNTINNIDYDDNEPKHEIIRPKSSFEKNHPIMEGTLYSEKEMFRTNRTLLMGTPLIARNDPELFDIDINDGSVIKKQRYDFDDDNGNDAVMDANAEESSGNSINFSSSSVGDSEIQLPKKVAIDAIAIASRIQVDLEDIVMDFVKHYKEKTGESNLCLAGGVALNSVLNGRLSRELGFQNTFIPPYPGDDGIAVGCCAFGLYGNSRLASNHDYHSNNKPNPKIWNQPLSPYLGPEPTEYDMKKAIDAASSWLDVEFVRDENQKLDIMVKEVESGGVIAWYHGRSELGPRALGHRSILADPRKKGLVRFINQAVKKRESFRPFAPSVLAEEASNWFHLGENNYQDNVSPYMSLTAFVREDKRRYIPAVTHVDGSSRLQTVIKEAEPLYHKFISKFFKKTGVPLVLNTSFNTLPGEPIVETPKNAIRSFLCSMGSLEMLVMGDYIIKRKKANLRKLIEEESPAATLYQAGGDGTSYNKNVACPKRAGHIYFQASFELEDGQLNADDENDPAIVTQTKVKMPDRPMHNDNKDDWFPLVDELEGELLSICDGTVTLNEMLYQYTASPPPADGEQAVKQENEKEEREQKQILVQNIIQRLIRLYEHTFIYW